MNKRIMIVQDEIPVAKDQKLMLENNGFEVVGIASTYAKAIHMFNQEHPDLLICDINLRAEKNGIDVVETTRKFKSVPVIFVSTIVDSEIQEKALSIHPESFLAKPFCENQLIITVKRVLNGDKKIHPNKLSVSPTKRELEVIQLIAKGYTTKHIADILSISFETVQSHRKNVLGKFKLSSSAELISIAYANNWVN